MNEIISFTATWMDLEIIILSQTEKDKYQMISLIIWYHFYVESKEKVIQMNLFTKQKQTHRLWKQTYGYQRENLGGEG